MDERQEIRPLVAYYKPNPAVVARLFCFPYAGGGASVFVSWSDVVRQQRHEIGLGAEIDICRVELAGREDRISEPPLTSVSALASEAVVALSPLFDMPFAFFGHSLGAVIAYEAAEQLRISGRPNRAC